MIVAEADDDEEAGRRDREPLVAATLEPRKTDAAVDAGGGNTGTNASTWGTRLLQEATAAARAAVRTRAGPMTLVRFAAVLSGGGAFCLFKVCRCVFPPSD